ncbi:hypothetical protein LTR94_030017, partial [Friedmanniomyces endolithicus]
VDRRRDRAGTLGPVSGGVLRAADAQGLGHARAGRCRRARQLGNDVPARGARGQRCAAGGASLPAERRPAAAGAGAAGGGARDAAPVRGCGEGGVPGSSTADRRRRYRRQRGGVRRQCAVPHLSARCVEGARAGHGKRRSGAGRLCQSRARGGVPQPVRPGGRGRTCQPDDDVHGARFGQFGRCRAR